MLEAKKFKLGVFVSAGISLLVIGLLAHGLADKFKKKYLVYTVFDESVQGLEIGAAAKYKGVTVGRVKEIFIFEDQYIRVNIETTSKRASDNGEMETDQQRAREFAENLNKQIEQGLICELASAGITGMKFIELSHYQDRPETLAYVPKDDEMLYIPSKKSLISTALTGVDEIIRNLGKVDFAAMSDEITATLKTTRAMMEDPEISATLKEAKGLFASTNSLVNTLENSIDENEVKALMTEATKTMKSLSELSATAKDELKKAGLAELSDETKATVKKMNEGLTQFNQSIAKLEKDLSATLQATQFLVKNINKTIDTSTGDFDEFKGKIIKSTESLNKTLRQVEAFFRLIEEDPASLIHGKKD